MKEKATIVFSDGKKAYEGDIEDGFLNGNGTLYYHDTQTIQYEGEWRRNLPEGVGKAFRPDGTLWYEGSWKAGLREGHGKDFDTNGTTKYEGAWKNNHPEGQGIKYHPSGKPWYEGSFKAGEADGYGKAYFEDGPVAYDGLWRNGIRHGLGKLYGAEGHLEYFGPWKDGKIWEEEQKSNTEPAVESFIESKQKVLTHYEGTPELLSSGELIVEITACLTPHFLPLSDTDENWNPFVATLKQFETNPQLRYEDSVLKGYYDSYPRENLQQAFLLPTRTELKPFWDLKPHAKFPLPWSNPEAYARTLLKKGFLQYNDKVLPASDQNVAETARMVIDMCLHRPFSSWVPDYPPQIITNMNRPVFYEYGPIPENQGEAIFRKLVRVYESVRTIGYLPGLFPERPISGTLLLAKSRYRFVAESGFFLLSALSALGCQTVAAVLSPESDGIVERDQLPELPFVKTGVYTEEVANILFDHAFLSFKEKLAGR